MPVRIMSLRKALLGSALSLNASCVAEADLGIALSPMVVVAQLVERGIVVPDVTGSNPVYHPQSSGELLGQSGPQPTNLPRFGGSRPV